MGGGGDGWVGGRGAPPEARGVRPATLSLSPRVFDTEITVPGKSGGKSPVSKFARWSACASLESLGRTTPHPSTCEGRVAPHLFSHRRRETL